MTLARPSCPRATRGPPCGGRGPRPGRGDEAREAGARQAVNAGAAQGIMKGSEEWRDCAPRRQRQARRSLISSRGGSKWTRLMMRLEPGLPRYRMSMAEVSKLLTRCSRAGSPKRHGGVISPTAMARGCALPEPASPTGPLLLAELFLHRMGLRAGHAPLRGGPSEAPGVRLPWCSLRRGRGERCNGRGRRRSAPTTPSVLAKAPTAARAGGTSRLPARRRRRRHGSVNSCGIASPCWRPPRTAARSAARGAPLARLPPCPPGQAGATPRRLGWRTAAPPWPVSSALAATRAAGCSWRSTRLWPKTLRLRWGPSDAVKAELGVAMRGIAPCWSLCWPLLGGPGAATLRWRAAAEQLGVAAPLRGQRLRWVSWPSLLPCCKQCASCRGLTLLRLRR